MSDVESVDDFSSSVDVESASAYFACSTPTSSLGSPRGFMESEAHQCGTCLPHGCEGCGEVQSCAYPACARTRLTSAAPSFQPAVNNGNDMQMDVVTSCIQASLASSGQTRHIKVEKGINGTSSTGISAELYHGLDASVPSYEVIQLVKRSLNSIVSQSATIALLSSRIQKEQWGYSLRSSIACVPDHAQDKMCWDLFTKGHCPRHSTCRWYHPQDADIRKLKVSIRCSEGVSNVLQEKCEPSSAEKHKISLDELVLVQ